MSLVPQILAPRQQFVDGSGLIAKGWWRCLHDLFNFVNNGGQWNDVASLRSVGAQSTNIQGKLIEVSVSVQSSASATFSAVVSGLIIAETYQLTAGHPTTLHFSVPNGSDYSVTCSAGTPHVVVWAERF